MLIPFIERATRHRVPRQAFLSVLVCGSLLANVISTHAAGSAPLKSYGDADITFLYPSSWFTQPVSGQTGVVLVSNNQGVIKTASTSSTPVLTKGQVLIEIIAGAAAISEVTTLKATGTALDTLTAFIKNRTTTVTYSIPEAINLINVTDAAQASLKDSASKNDGLLMLLSPPDHPVFIVALVSQGQLSVDQLLIQGIASTIQPGGTVTTPSTAATAAATAVVVPLTQTFKNTIYTLKYPAGWVASSPSGNPTAIYLATDQTLLASANSGKFSMSSGQILIGAVSGADAYSMAGTSVISAPSPSGLIAGLKTQFVDSSSAILSSIGQSTDVTIGTAPGAVAPVSLKAGGDGYVIAFYQNKHPVLMLCFTGTGEADANLPLFEQIAASIVLGV